jgi:hypothetical protein
MNSYGKPGCKDAVWKKGKKINGFNPNEWRKDKYGNKICYQEHGKTTEYGWDIDHYIPKTKCGSDDIHNLYPVQYSKNRSMGIKMNEKNKKEWFHSLEEKHGITNSKKATHFRYIIGEQVMVKQTPSSKPELAIIRSIDPKKEKVNVYWISSGYSENIEMYNQLFDELPKKRNSTLQPHV